MMKHILLPIDGSECALRAVAAANEMALAFGAKVTLLYVIPDPRKEGVIQGQEAMILSESKAAPLARQHLEKAQKSLDPGIQTAISLQKGVVSRTIEKEAASNDYDFIVMGTEGMGSALKRLLLGSVTRHVLEHVTIPVLVIR
ncbi:universal stress protein [Peptococcus simiae]|uniref:Universal stress protein n=1 Tax=Peptococcus simiae TaxID=1643805 RepID=A0ABW9GY01_9FIRM